MLKDQEDWGHSTANTKRVFNHDVPLALHETDKVAVDKIYSRTIDIKKCGFTTSISHIEVWRPFFWDIGKQNSTR